VAIKTGRKEKNYEKYEEEGNEQEEEEEEEDGTFSFNLTIRVISLRILPNFIYVDTDDGCGNKELMKVVSLIMMIMMEMVLGIV